MVRRADGAVVSTTVNVPNSVDFYAAGLVHRDSRCFHDELVAFGRLFMGAQAAIISTGLEAASGVPCRLCSV